MYGEVKEPYWDEVWIIGGGNSAEGFDFSRLINKTVVMINASAARYWSILAESMAVFSLDQNWIRRNLEFLRTAKGVEKYLAVPLETWPDLDDIPGVTYLQWSHADGLSEDPRFVCTGCNSGYAAINLALLKGAKTIHLVGYDMHPDDDHDQYQYWAPAFRTMLPQLKKHGVTVLNHNKSSYIDAFVKVD